MVYCFHTKLKYKQIQVKSNSTLFYIGSLLDLIKYKNGEEEKIDKTVRFMEDYTLKR